ncbi:Required for respiratory growth protein 9 mitochondrial [Coemansia spiralis]|nr:Required for respiratory growth protein 9 mitochondrial [Coemansia spiralis]
MQVDRAARQVLQRWCSGTAPAQRVRMSSQAAHRSLGKSILFGAAAPAVDSAKPGFVKVAHKKEAGEAPQMARATTQTRGAQQSTAAWRESDAGQQRMRERLKSTALAGWQRRKIEMKLKLGDAGWEPEKRIATSSMEKIRLLNAEFPEQWTMERLSEQFKISQESVRRILKSKFRPSKERTEKRERLRKQQIDTFKEAAAARQGRPHLHRRAGACDVHTEPAPTQRKPSTRRGRSAH